MADINLSLTAGARFEISGAEMEICFADLASVRYTPMVGGTPSTIARSRLLKKLEASEWKLTFSPPTRDSNVLSATSLRDKELRAATRRLNYVVWMHFELGAIWRRKDVVKQIEFAAKKHEDPKPPSVNAVYRWRKTSLVLGTGLGAMALANHQKGGYSRFSVEAEETIRQALSKYYLTGERNSVKECRELMIAELAKTEKLELIFPDGVPEVRTWYRRAEQLDGFAKVASRHGIAKAIRQFKAAGRSDWTTRALQKVQGDGQLLDVLVVPEDENGDPMPYVHGAQGHYRPFATVLIDCFSRAVPALLCTAAPYSTCTVVAAMKIAVVKNGDLPRGVPLELEIDNGSDYISDGLKRVAERINMEIVWCEPRTPDQKAIVEAFIGGLTALIHKLPGTVYSNPEDRGDYPSERLACLTLRKLQEIIDEWLVIYHKSLHSTTGRAPLELWRESVAAHPVRTETSEEMDLIARVPERRMVVSGRVQVDENFWYSTAAATWEQNKRRKNQDPLVDVLIDEFDLGRVVIQTADDDRTIFLADATRPHYQNGLSAYEHQLLRAELKAKGEEDLAKLEDLELEKRKLALREKIQAEANKSRNSARKAARLRKQKAKQAEATPAPPVAASITALEALPSALPVPTPTPESQDGSKASWPEGDINFTSPKEPMQHPIDDNAVPTVEPDAPPPRTIAPLRSIYLS